MNLPPHNPWRLASHSDHTLAYQSSCRCWSYLRPQDLSPSWTLAFGKRKRAQSFGNIRCTFVLSCLYMIVHTCWLGGDFETLQPYLVCTIGMQRMRGKSWLHRCSRSLACWKSSRWFPTGSFQNVFIICCRAVSIYFRSLGTVFVH